MFSVGWIRIRKGLYVSKSREFWMNEVYMYGIWDGVSKDGDRRVERQDAV